MKSIKSLIALTLVALTCATQAAGSEWPPAPWTRVSTRKQVETCCDAGGKVAITCKDCKGMTEAKDKKHAASFYDVNATHECDGCKGKITLRQIAAGRKDELKFTHDCTKCGKGTAFTCATHVKGAK